MLSPFQKYFKKGSCENKVGRYHRMFVDVQEFELLKYVFHVDNLFYGLTKTEFWNLWITKQKKQTNIQTTSNKSPKILSKIR